MRRCKTDEHVHHVFVSLQMLDRLTGYNASQRVPYEVYLAVIVERVQHMQPNLGRHGLSKLLNRVINVILNSLDQKTITMRVIDVHEISGFFQVDTTPLVPVNHYHQRISFSLIFRNASHWLIVLDNKEGMMNLLILIDIHLSQNLPSLPDKFLPTLINLVLHNI